MISKAQTQFFLQEGYLVVHDLISEEEISYYDQVYNSFLDNTIDGSMYRSDLSGDDRSDQERITQIMVPGKVFPELLNKPVHQRTLQIAKALMGDDLELDFDMLINKAPMSNTITPWHQDAAYWIAMPDTRALSFWVAIDKATKANGCMWYTPQSHLEPTRRHIQTGNKGALKCEGSEDDSVCVELNPGSCVIHHGNTLHYSRGNSTHHHRRALITNYRPKAMIDLQRAKGYDHTGERNLNP
jgi:ectoine hydroxylase-related dioxygenase (phytanoyl-CoA dioxygenase family)